VKLLKQGNETLLTKVRKLLDVYRYVGSKDLLLAEVDLRSMIHSCIGELEPMAKDKNLKIVQRLPRDLEKILAHWDSMHSLVINLLENAIKFTPPSGEIEISAQQTDGQAIIHFKDSGPGISREDQAKLFKRFWQGEAGKKYSSGTGLGLYICRQIVTFHKGSIECVSKPGSGTTFTVTLPKRQMPENDGAQNNDKSERLDVELTV